MVVAVVVVVGAWRKEFDLQTYAPTPHSVGVRAMGALKEEEKGERRRNGELGEKGGRGREREGEGEGEGKRRGGGGRGERGRERGRRRRRRSLPVEVFLHPNLLQQPWILHVCKVMENKTKLSD